MMKVDAGRVALFAGVLSLALTGCGSSSGPDASGERGEAGRTFIIAPGENATEDALAAFIQAAPKDIIQFECGFFDIATGLVLQSTENIVIRGCGRDETVLSFASSDSPEGIQAINVRGLLIEDLTVIDTPGDGIKILGADIVTMRSLRTMWSSADNPTTADNYLDNVHVACTSPPANAFAPTPDYKPSGDSGRYGIYPVQSNNILVDDVEAIGASDAGVYVGQTNNSIVRNSRALYNVMGYEIENTRGGEYVGNIAECNTGGFLIYDLDGLSQYGWGVRMHGNVARNNNTYNFTHLGGFIAAVPRGAGLIVLANDQVEIFDNEFHDHDTASVIIPSYELLGGTSDRRLSGYSEGIHIHNNLMTNAGRNPPLPDLGRVLLEGDQASLLPTLIRIKNLGTGAHIIWDGLYDEVDENCPWPVDKDGNAVPANDQGRPVHLGDDPNPECHYNAYKFDEDGARIKPDFFICINDNQFENGLPPDYVNFHGLGGLELLDLLDDPSLLLNPEYVASVLSGVTELLGDRDISVHDCQARFGRTPEPLPEVVLDTYTPGDSARPAPTPEEIAALCERSPEPGRVNRAALEVNCPRLDQYNLFDDAQDPRSTPHDGGVPFVLNSRLFSDYAVKYRVAFLPPGEAAVFRDADDGVNQPLQFPVGTVIAKTFAFADEGTGVEEVIETRLLIKRRNDSGQPRWDGLPYIWEVNEDAERIAVLSMGGGRTPANWHYHDSESGELYHGATSAYAIPHGNQCITCHGNSNLTPGSAPIGPKPRNLNRPYRPESSFAAGLGQGDFAAVNQIQYWRDQGLLVGGPADLDVDPDSGVARAVERLPIYNLPGDAGFEAHSKEDIEARTRAYLEINCQNCHNQRGAASNTGYFLDSFRTIDRSYGICKTPTAAGGGTGGRSHVVVPMRAGESILPFRMGSNDTEARMPPMARSIAHDEGVALIEQWINTVVDDSYADAESCTGGGGLFPWL